MTRATSAQDGARWSTTRSGQRGPVRCGRARSSTWTRPSTRPSAGWSTDASRHEPCRAWRSPSGRRRLGLLDEPRHPGRDRLRLASSPPRSPSTVIAELLGIDEADREDFRRWSDAAIESPDLPPDETMAALGRALGIHRGAHPVEARAAGGRPRVAARGQRGRGLPAEQGGAVHVPPDPAGGGQRDDAHAAVGDRRRPARAPGPACALVGRPVAGAGGSGGVPALGHAGPRLLPHRHRGRAWWRTPRSAKATTSACSTPRATGTSGSSGTDASRFDVRRRTNPVHLAFGFGEHVCLGASLARLEARIFVEELLGRFPDYEVTGPAERVLSTTVAGIRSLPVVLAPAGSQGPSAPCSTAWRSSSSSDSTAAGSALSRSRPALALRAHQPVLAQHLHVHAHGGLGQTEQHRQLAHRARRGGQRVQERQTGGIGHRLEPPGHRFGPRPGHGIALADAGSDDDEVGELQVHARPEEQARDEEERLARPRRWPGSRAGAPARCHTPAVSRVSSDRPRSYCATTWRPASSMTGSACCHMCVHGRPDLLEEVEVRAAAARATP